METVVGHDLVKRGLSAKIYSKRFADYYILSNTAFLLIQVLKKNDSLLKNRYFALKNYYFVLSTSNLFILGIRPFQIYYFNVYMHSFL